MLQHRGQHSAAQRFAVASGKADVGQALLRIVEVLAQKAHVGKARIILAHFRGILNVFDGVMIGHRELRVISKGLSV